jgi:hypothetical protein
MRIFTVFTIALTLVVGVFFPREANAERATPQEMELVCQNWLAYMVYQQGGWAGDVHPTVVGVSELVQDDTVLARCFTIAPRGYVAVPILKELPPIKAYSEEYGLDVSEIVGFPQLLREVLLARIRSYAKTYGSLDATQPSRGTVLLDRVHRREWERYLMSREQFDADLRGDAFERLTQAGPLLTTSWHQCAPYNALCPMGDQDCVTCPGGGTPCFPSYVGCVATAAAQIMRYHQWPMNGIGGYTHTSWNGDQSCGGTTPWVWPFATFSDCYDWAHMPDSCDFGCSPEDSAALAELCYEVSVAFCTDYGVCVSYAYTDYALTVFPTYFRYSNSIDKEERSAYTAQTWFNLIQAEVNAGRPMQYKITSHSVVCDGWRDTGGQNQYHINYGWGGPHTDWFAIDNIYLDSDPLNDYLIRNIIPVYELGGEVCGTLQARSYTVVSDIWVNAGSSLTIQPGAVLNFAGPYRFRILGALLAQGTANDSIVFTSNQSDTNRWRGLRFEGAASSGTLSYCRIENGYAIGNNPNDCGGGVVCYDHSSPSFTNCVIRGNSAQAAGGGVACDHYCSPSFSLCEISGNSADSGGGGVSCNWACSPTFTNCTVSGNSALSGGGLWNYYWSSPTLTDCQIDGNSATERGGGIFFHLSCQPRFTDCTISDNDAGYGGGAYCSNSYMTLTNCTLSGNMGVEDCGGVYSDTSDLWIVNCLLNDNNSAGSVGAVRCFYSEVSFMNCTISGNAGSEIGGMYCGNSWMYVYSTIIAFSNGSGIFFENDPGSWVDYCDIFGNSGGDIAFYENNPDNGPPGIGQFVTTNANGDSCDQDSNICVDPMFADTAVSDFHLIDFSPCIGAANFGGEWWNVDFEGDPRPNPWDSYPDIGMDEHWLAGPVRHLVITMVDGYAVLRWPWFAWSYSIYGTVTPFTEGTLLDWTEDTVWADEETSSRPSPYFYYVTAGEEEP